MPLSCISCWSRGRTLFCSSSLHLVYYTSLAALHFSSISFLHLEKSQEASSLINLFLASSFSFRHEATSERRFPRFFRAPLQDAILHIQKTTRSFFFLLISFFLFTVLILTIIRFERENERREKKEKKTDRRETAKKGKKRWEMLEWSKKTSWWCDRQERENLFLLSLDR